MLKEKERGGEKMIIRCLEENTTKTEGITAEHGLSLLIETEKHKLLFDMGQTDAFLHNAEQMGVDLKEVDLAVLSHGHYDHGGGLPYFLRVNRKAPVYLSKYAFEPHYNGTQKYIGLCEELHSPEFAGRLHFTDADQVLDEELTLLPCKNRKKEYPVVPFGLTMMEGDRLVPEDFRHEQCLLIREKGKQVLISGCSHNGVLNITRAYQPDILVGGFHFSKLDPETAEGAESLAASAEILNREKTVYYTCHCTGVPQYEYLKTKMGEKLHYLSAGDVIEL